MNYYLWENTKIKLDLIMPMNQLPKACLIGKWIGSFSFLPDSECRFVGLHRVINSLYNWPRFRKIEMPFAKIIYVIYSGYVLEIQQLQTQHLPLEDHRPIYFGRFPVAHDQALGRLQAHSF